MNLNDKYKCNRIEGQIMIKPELYIEFREDRTDKITVEKAELRSKLNKIKRGVILEHKYEKYLIYYSRETTRSDMEVHEPLFHLVIDPAARIRFEGSLSEYDKLVEEIKSKNLSRDDTRVYSKVQDGNADSDFFIIDVYYQM